MQPALGKEHYVSAAAYDVERERVLLREWTCVGRALELGVGPDASGRVAVVEVHGESVLLVRTDVGRLTAFYNVCRHRGSQLVPVAAGDADSIAPLAVRALRCPYHSWTYDLDGRLMRAPHTEDVDDFDPACFSLHRVGVEEWAGFVFVHLTPSAAGPLADSLGAVPVRLQRYPLASLRVGWSTSYDVQANWKLVAENYNECYHCAGVHPELCRLVPAFARGGRDLEWEAGVPHRDGAWTFTMSGTSERAPFDGLDDDERVRHKGELVYPNLLLSLSADHVAAFTMWPLAHDRTRIDCSLLFAVDEIARPAFDPSDAADLWDLVNRQDWAICESVQRGMSSRAYAGGWFAPMEDESLDIRRWLLPRLGRTDAI
jgi:phenylpropionate dioxygenase-like ring-hydroxylating dioxygenase large terminal subunit